MTWLLAGLTALAAAGYVLLPYFRGQLPSSLEGLGWGWRARHQDLEARRQSLRQAVEELETDRRTGRLDEDTYQRMRGDYRDQMALLLQELDGLEAEVEGYIETRLRELREATE